MTGKPPLGHAATPGGQAETGFQRAVIDAAEHMGLRVFWIPSMARTNIGRVAKTARGWPDLVIAGDHGALFRELKTEYGDASAEQDLWLWLLHHAGLDAGIWRPADLDSGRITAELEAIA